MKCESYPWRIKMDIYVFKNCLGDFIFYSSDNSDNFDTVTFFLNPNIKTLLQTIMVNFKYSGEPILNIHFKKPCDIQYLKGMSSVKYENLSLDEQKELWDIFDNLDCQ